MAGSDKEAGASEPTEPLSFYARLAKVQKAVGRIPKTGVNKDQGGYKFLEETAIVEAVVPLLVEHGIFMTIKQVRGSEKIEQVTYGSRSTLAFKAQVDVDVIFIDTLSNAREEYPGHGFALDTGDKGFQKAVTSAAKYAVYKAFAISTGEVDLDNESQEQRDERARGKAAQPKQAATPVVSADEVKALGKRLHELDPKQGFNTLKLMWAYVAQFIDKQAAAKKALKPEQLHAMSVLLKRQIEKALAPKEAASPAAAAQSAQSTPSGAAAEAEPLDTEDEEFQP